MKEWEEYEVISEFWSVFVFFFLSYIDEKETKDLQSAEISQLTGF